MSQLICCMYILFTLHLKKMNGFKTDLYLPDTGNLFKPDKGNLFQTSTLQFNNTLI